VTVPGKVPSRPAHSGGHGPRRRARVACVRALYRAEVVGDAPAELARELASDETITEEVRSYAHRLISLVADHAEEIDRILSAALVRWDLTRLAVTDRCVLRMGAAEILYEPEVPTRVILDEAIEIAKRYGSGESGRFVNGVLDRVARERREESAHREDL
jgi:N utilization substance protein B